MLNDNDLRLLREQLKESKAALESDGDIRKSNTQTVELDQSKTGRLSRMDALQGQSMAKATEARALQQLQRIQTAFRRIDEGTYGECVRCEEPIALERLQADPATVLCIACAERAEQR